MVVNLRKYADVLGYIHVGDCPERHEPGTGEINFDKIKQVVIEEGVKSIGAAAFRRCANLQYVKLPKTLEYIGDYAFSGCTAMKTIRIPANTKTIRATAFQKCTARVIRELVM